MLEILASVHPCPSRSFLALEHLVLDHISAVSGCVCVLLAWDEPRRGFVRKLQALGIPLRVFVIVGPEESAALEPGPLRDEPHNFHVLQTGRVERALACLKS